MIVRSPVDVLRLVVAGVALVVTLLVERLFGDTLVTFAGQLLVGLGAVPQWLTNAIVIGVHVVALVVLLDAAVLTIVRHRWRVLGTVALAVGLAAALVWVLQRATDTPTGRQVTRVTIGGGVLTSSTSPTAVGVAAFAAVLTAAAPWLSRRWRRWGWVAVLGLAVVRFATSPMSFDTLEALLAGWVAGAGTLVALGGPSRRPTMAAIEDGLAAVAAPVGALEPANVDARGSTPYFGTGADGTRYFVKALGTDQRSADLLFRLYRSRRRSQLGDERPFSSLRRAVEHEAFVSLAARDLGVRTPRMAAFATVEPSSFVLAYEVIAGRSLDRVEPAELTDEILGAVWEQLALLRAHRIAHRDLRLANVFLADDGQVWIIDFGFSELAASDLVLATDVAEFTASSSVVTGAARALAAARATVDPSTLTAARARLRPGLLSGATRTALGERPGLLEELRAGMVG